MISSGIKDMYLRLPEDQETRSDKNSKIEGEKLDIFRLYVN